MQTPTPQTQPQTEPQQELPPLTMPTTGQLVLRTRDGRATIIATPNAIVSIEPNEEISFVPGVSALRGTPNGPISYSSSAMLAVDTTEAADRLTVGGEAQPGVAVRNGTSRTIDNPATRDQVVQRIRAVMADQQVIPSEEAWLNYTLDDTLDDGLLNDSAPNNPNPPLSLPTTGQQVWFRDSQTGNPVMIATPTGLVRSSTTSSSYYSTQFSELRGIPGQEINYTAARMLAVDPSKQYMILRDGRGNGFNADDPAVAAQVHARIARVMGDGIVAPTEEAELNYTLDDIMDDQQLNNSVPRVTVAHNTETGAAPGRATRTP